MTNPAPFSLELLNSIEDCDKKLWDDFANGGGEQAYNPFIQYDFLNALEKSGSVGIGTGWHARHAVLNDENGIIGLAPMYLKTHSQGEYVFDYGWANAFEQAGGAYYPKLQISVPFTPATGPRLLVKDEEMRGQMASALGQACQQLNLSSLHCTFINENDRKAFEEAGYLIRSDQQFHFENAGFDTFEDFLASLTSRKRKAISKERREAIKNDVTIRHITGDELTQEHWDAFFEFYIDTGNRKWGQPYLTREFFSLVSEKMADDILLILAYRNDKPIAGALNFIGSDTLFGRHWGCTEHHPFLHFEVCYYQAIDFALARGLKFVEAGAQGSHKLARGYMPKTTYSAHFIAHPQFKDAIERYLAEERRAISHENELLKAAGPFKKLD